MKKYFILATAAAAVLASCTKVTMEEAPEQEISFIAQNYTPGTKATDEGADVDNLHRVFYSQGHFGVFSYFSPTSEFSGLSQVYMDNAEIFKGAQQGSEYQNVYSAADKYYWPKAGSLSFIGYYPYVANTDKNVTVVTPANSDNKLAINIASYTVEPTCAKQQDKVTVDENDAIVNNLNDLMAADEALNKTANGAGVHYAEGVPMLFRHLLAKVIFKAQAKKVDDKEAALGLKVVITKIEINGINNTGKYEPTYNADKTLAATWKNQDGTVSSESIYAEAPTYATPLPVQTEGVANAAVQGNEYFVLPQTLGDDAVIYIEYEVYTVDATGNAVAPVKYPKNADDMSTTFKISDLTATWSDNTVYTYTLTIDPFTGEITFDPAIVDWTNADNKEIK